METNLENFNSYINIPLFQTEELISTLPIEKELWLMLKSVYYVEKEAKRIISERRKVSFDVASSIYQRFRSFCRQAENYFDIAVNLPWNSSPLLYYYSFINLAKAILLLNKDIPNKVFHGLSCDVDDIPVSIDQQNVDVKANYDKDVFPMLYEYLIGNKLSDTVIKIPLTTLLGYLEDVTFQVNQIAHINVLRVACKYRRLFTDNNKYRVIMLVPDFTILDKGYPFSDSFKQKFELISITKDNRRKIYNKLCVPFESEAREFQAYRIYQSTDLFDHNNIAKAFTDIFGASLQRKCHHQESDFTVNLPFKISIDNGWKYMNEFLSIYVIMFYLSSLVRYRPDFLDSVENSQERYLYESFILSCPRKFLRNSVNLIHGKNYIIRN